MTKTKKKFSPKKLKAALEEAMEHPKEIEKSLAWVNSSLPDIIPSHADWPHTEEKIEAFRALVEFARMTIFGVDCDSDCQIRYRIQDRKREEDFLPMLRVPRVDWDGPVYPQFRAVSNAKAIAASAQSTVERMEKGLQHDIEEIVQLHDLKRKAKYCDICGRKGWVDTDKDTWVNLDYGVKCQTKILGCNFRDDKPPYRIFCECQEDEE